MQVSRTPKENTSNVDSLENMDRKSFTSNNKDITALEELMISIHNIHCNESNENVVNNVRFTGHFNQENEDDLEKFYEQKQFVFEEALLKKSSNKTSTGWKEKKKNQIETSFHSVRNKPRSESVKVRNITPNRDTKNVGSSNNERNIVTYSEYKHGLTPKKSSQTAAGKMTRSNSIGSLSINRKPEQQTINKNMINIKLRINNDSIENISEINDDLASRARKSPIKPQNKNSNQGSFRTINKPRASVNKSNLNIETALDKAKSNVLTILGPSSVRKYLPVTLTNQSINFQSIDKASFNDLNKSGITNEKEELNSNFTSNLSTILQGRRLSNRHFFNNSNEEKPSNRSEIITQLKDNNIKCPRHTIQSEFVGKSLPDENYTEEIKRIYTKRKAERKQGEKQDAYEQFYLKNLKWKKVIEEQITEAKQKQDVDQLKSCSFAPVVTDSSRKILSKSVGYLNSAKEDFYSKNLKWKQQVEKFKQDEFIQKERKEYEECLFKPSINKTSDLSNIDNDYVYKKNVKWLKKINENNKIRQLEFEEQFKDSNKHVSIRERMSKSKLNRRDDLYQGDSTNLRINTEEKLKNELASMPNLLGTNIIDDKPHIDKEISELKGLITSLKTTLEENKKLITEQNNYININESYNISINSANVTKSQTERVPFKHEKKIKHSETVKTNKTDDYEEKYEKLLEKYHKTKNK